MRDRPPRGIDGNPATTRSRPLLGALKLLAVGFIITSAAGPASASPLPWTHLELEGRKLFLEARVALQATVVPSATIRSNLVDDAEHDGLPAARRTLRLPTTTRLLNRTTEIETLLYWGDSLGTYLYKLSLSLVK